MANGSYMGNMLMWIGIYMGMSFFISFAIPFPASLLAIFIAIIVIDYARARWIMKKMGINGMKQMFNSFSAQTGYHQLKYFCMSCGFEHREISCPKCGSKMTRIG